MKSGFFIALEGIDGAGTTSQMQPIAQALRALGYLVTLTAEPSQGAAGLLLRQALQGSWPLDEAGMGLLFAVDRLDHLAATVEPHLQAGHVVITDRYLMSSYAYQSTALGLDWVKNINKHARLPDAHLFFRLSWQTAALRRKGRGAPAERFDADTRQRAVAAGYERLLTGPDAMAHVHVIDAEQNMAQVTKNVIDCICALLQTHQVPRAIPACELPACK
jgi:dTMP kinase